MEVTNPRRILAVCLEGQENHLSRVLKDLTGNTPQATSSSLAGTTHTLPLKTQYYTASVPVWLDLIASPSEWAESFLSDEAGEVLAVLGGLVLVFALPGSGSPADKTSATTTTERIRSAVHHVGEVVNKGLGGWEWDGVRLAIGVGESHTDGGASAEEWDELCAEAGLEFVQLGGTQTKLNEFGEKTGIARVKEALEANDWGAAEDDASSDFGDFEGGSEKDDGTMAEKDLDPDNLDFGFDADDVEGLKRAIWENRPLTNDNEGEGTSMSNLTAQSSDKSASSATETFEAANTGQQLDENDVIKVEEMMRRLQAVREAGEGLPEAQRRRMAARAVEEVMKEL